MAIKKAAAKPMPKPPLAPPPSVLPPPEVERNWRVRIRMYRPWLGDCFLLTFRQDHGEKHILIDCGAFNGTTNGKDLLTAAVQDILTTTDKKLAALVVTHEHWDHVAGFSFAPELFAQFTVGEVWAAWTEDPTQTVAKEKKKQNANQLAAIGSALQQWNESNNEGQQQIGAAVSSLLGFLPPPGVAAFSEGSDSAMTAALKLGPVQFLEPGDVLRPAWLPGVRAFVLGPPESLKSLHDEMGNPDTDLYSLSAAAASATQAFSAAARNRKAPASDDNYRPFDRYLQWDRDQWAHKWPGLGTGYAADEDRRIDGDWLNSAADFALQLDVGINNTSLVLAFQFEDTEEVLLFVGDAQIGNWLTWANVKFQGSDATASDLLARTVFYKVGHHGSHNATLKTGGLDLMTSPRLVAAIPVDEEFAHRPKGRNPDGWEMPAGPLLTALQQKTKGRVLRGDSNFPKDAAKPDALSNAEWTAFSNSVNAEPGYIEYFIK